MNLIKICGASFFAAALLSGCSSSSTVDRSSAHSGFSINDKAIYLRGEMNDYAVSDAYRLRASKHGFCTVALLRSDWAPYKFKFADADWSDGTNFGFMNPPGVLRNGKKSLELNQNSKFEEVSFYPKDDGVYRFCLLPKNNRYFVVVEKTSKKELLSMAQLMRISSLERLSD
ncbi:MAG: pullulanase [Succinivibrio sp.]|nr:pullulanase [Succinivibrio sp.]MBR1612433.1 pullulanase [Succinivibrio sp.]